MRGKKLTQLEVVTDLVTFNKLLDEGFRYEVVYNKMSTTRQRMHNLRKRVETYDRNALLDSDFIYDCVSTMKLAFKDCHSLAEAMNVTDEEWDEFVALYEDALELYHYNDEMFFQRSKAERTGDNAVKLQNKATELLQRFKEELVEYSSKCESTDDLSPRAIQVAKHMTMDCLTQCCYWDSKWDYPTPATIEEAMEIVKPNLEIEFDRVEDHKFCYDETTGGGHHCLYHDVVLGNF